MTANTFFEVFNHFLFTKDSDQVSKLASNIGGFKSESFGDGSFIHGAEAPSAFRLALKQIMKSKDQYAMEVVNRSGSENAAIFIVNLKQSSKSSSSALSVGISKQELVYFVETLV